MKKLLQALRALATTHYVTVVWGNMVAHHQACGRKEALAWAACYPADAAVLITGFTGRVVAQRG